MKTVLSIAGSDCSGGAGIQADLKTMLANGVYGMSVVTALTAQNTMGVTAVFDTTPEFLGQQLDCIFTDIYPDAIKIGMVSQASLIEVVAERLKYYGAKHIVLDPVMVATSGARLISEDAIEALTGCLFPLVELITPNIPEAEVLTGCTIHDRSDMETSAKKIGDHYGCNVLLKGGHGVDDANDLLYHDGGFCWFLSERINNPNTHGTGCTLSSAIASNLAKGCGLREAVTAAKEYLTGALADGLDLGRGSGPLNHGYAIRFD